MRKKRMGFKKVICPILVFAMLVTAFMGNGKIVKATATNTYQPYVENGEVKNAPAVGTILKEGDKIIELSSDVYVSLWLHGTQEDCTPDNQAYGDGADTYGDAQEIIITDDMIWYASGQQGYQVTNVRYVEETIAYQTLKYIQIFAFSVEGPQIMESVGVSVNWEKLDYIKIGEGLTERTAEERRGVVSVSGEGVGTVTEAWNDDFQLLIKATQEHVEKGYLDLEQNYLFAEIGDWVSSSYYDDSYIVSATDQMAYSATAVTEEIGGVPVYFAGEKSDRDEDISSRIDTNGGKFTIEKADAYGYMQPYCNVLGLVVGLGTAEDIVKCANMNDNDAKLVNEADAKNKITLTDTEQQEIASGKELEVVLKFDNVGNQADTTEKKVIEEKLGANKLATFLDINLIKKIGTSESAVTETKEPIAISFELSSEFKNTNSSIRRTFKIMRNHNGTVEFLDTKYDSTTNRIEFETDKFSTYALVYQDVNIANTTSPQTGDSASVLLPTVMVLVALVGMGTVVYNKKRTIY